MEASAARLAVQVVPAGNDPTVVVGATAGDSVPPKGDVTAEALAMVASPPDRAMRARKGAKAVSSRGVRLRKRIA